VQKPALEQQAGPETHDSSALLRWAVHRWTSSFPCCNSRYVLKIISRAAIRIGCLQLPDGALCSVQPGASGGRPAGGRAGNSAMFLRLSKAKEQLELEISELE
jgi:hypothetical protein